MDALLDLGLGGDSRSRGNATCQSVEDLQGQLDGWIKSKCTSQRVEHMSLTFEFRYQTTSMLSANLEEVSGHAQDPVMMLQNDGATRKVSAAEAIEKQPSDDPALQKAIAKQIVSRITVVDGTSWIAREVGRSSQGWTFTYICKESMQAWTRATAKTPGKTAIGEWTGPGGLDAVNAVRPAFDCRGTLSIAFSKASRAIVVKYEHSPLHKTVSQLIDMLAPPTVPSVSAKARDVIASRTPKTKRAPPADGVETSRKKKRPVPAEGEGKEGEPSVPKKKKPRKSKGKMSDPPAADAPGSEANAAPAQQPNGDVTVDATSPSAPNFTPLNVPPAEAERRREAAVRLLRGRGIEPSTLSNEQLNIFANQAPSLQETSLEMFAMYGAERLRIVHPNDSADTNSASPAPAATATTAPTSGPPIDPSLTGGGQADTSNESSSNQVSIGAGAVVAVEENGDVGTTASTLKLAGVRTTRGACDTCKKRKVKCTKERPECSNCVTTPGLQCYYAPVKPRRKSEKTPAEAVSDTEDVCQVAPEEQHMMQAESAQTETHSNNMQSACVPQQQADRLTFPQPEMWQQQAQPTTQYTTALDAVQQALGNQSSQSVHTPKQPKQQKQASAAAAPTITQTPVVPPKPTDSRRSLPNGPGPRQSISYSPSAIPVPQNHVPLVQANVTATPSPTTLARQVEARPRSRKPATTAIIPPPVLQHSPAYSQAVPVSRQPNGPINHVAYQTSPNPATVQPVRTHTPASTAYRASPQTAYAAVQPVSAPQSYPALPANGAASGHDSYQHYSNTRTDNQSASWRAQEASSISQETTAHAGRATPANGKRTAPTGLTLPSYATAEADSYAKRPSAARNAATGSQASASRGRTSSQATGSQWAAHQQGTSQPTSGYNNYNMPNSHRTATTTYGVDNIVSDGGSGSGSTYATNQAAYSNYNTQQVSNTDNHSQQNWYGLGSDNNNNKNNNNGNNRNSAYGASAGADNISTYQNNARSNNVSGYSGHGYDQTSEQNAYGLFQNSRQH